MTTPSEPATTSCSVDDTSAATFPTTPIPFNFILPVPASAPARVLTHTHPVPTVLLVTSPPPRLTDLFVQTISSALEQWHDEALREAPDECEVCGEAKKEVLMTPVSFLGDGESNTAGTEKQGDKEEEPIKGVVGVPEQDSPSKLPSRQQQSTPQKRIDVLITPICSRSSCAALARAKLRRVVEGQTQPSAPTSSTASSDPSQPLKSLFTPRDAQAIDDLAEAAQSFRHLPGPEDVRCVVCRKTKGTKKCARCGRVRYCGRECQRLDWKARHKRVCGVGVVFEGTGAESKGAVTDVWEH